MFETMPVKNLWGDTVVPATFEGGHKYESRQISHKNMQFEMVGIQTH